MARTADHDERRRQVAEALLRTVARRGLARTTLVDVAEEAGVSVGLVQRYFRSKADLLRFGVEHIYERSTARLAEVELAPPIRDLMLKAAETLLPLDGERRTELAVWLEFIAASLTDPEMARIHREATRRVIDGMADGLDGARERGELPAGLDPRAEAVALAAFVDGLALHHLATGEDFGAEAIRAALTGYIDRLFGTGGNR
ncbi:TetR/AcrR family transcriptional regulator [Nocardiopsis potens]|uniref:TetR/AcrR family transcriptional regulator n=1 Tax=Nocardiopsis potens TaxID=1246458 RepID=UPI0004759499|nr:TetR family transcriptional regulator C-terminal domain-containing protein [Nocardiopsis potens]